MFNNTLFYGYFLIFLVFILIKIIKTYQCHVTSFMNKVNQMMIIFEEYYKETMISEHLTDELEQLENQGNPNLEETEIVNLGDEEQVKEIRISVHLTKAQKRELIALLK